MVTCLFSADDVKRLSNNVFLTGGLSDIPGELQCCPFINSLPKVYTHRVFQGFKIIRAVEFRWKYDGINIWLMYALLYQIEENEIRSFFSTFDS